MDDLHDHQALTEQLAALLESTTVLQRKLAHVIAQLPAPAQRSSFPSAIDLHTPASAQASILAPGVPIPSRGWQTGHSPKERVIAQTKARLMRDGWEDCGDTDEHAARLSEAMLRMGLEDIDNFTTEASRLNCSNMAISATLVSAVVATFVSETYSNYETLHMQVVNSLWLLSLFLSLATATLCMLVSEWLTWSTSQELRDMSLLYRLIRTAFRSLLMHMSIFLFFAGLMVLMWNENTMLVCLVPSIAVAIFLIYYVSASVRSPFIALVLSIRQFGEDDFRGLRVQIWTPFTLVTHHTVDTIIKYGVRPVQRLLRRFSGITESKEKAEAHASDRPHRPMARAYTSEFSSAQKEMPPSKAASIQEIDYASPNALQHHAAGLAPTSAQTVPSRTLEGERSPVRGRALHPSSPAVELPHNLSRAGTPASESAVIEAEREHQRKLRAIRLRRMSEHEILRPPRGPRSAVV